MRRIAILLFAVAACFGYDTPAKKRRTTADSGIPGELQKPFVAPAHWDHIQLPSGLEFSQPAGFTIGVNDGSVGLCDASTKPAEVPVLALQISQRWPLTLAMRRGDRGKIAYANGFTLDTSDIAAHGQSAAVTRVRRGEGWILLSAPGTLFGAVKTPGGCDLVWAARGVNINVDTLGLVISTVRFAASPPPPQPPSTSDSTP
jgi:hypothetical protein